MKKLNTTADICRIATRSFDEPTDLDAPDREVLTPEEELARQQAQKKAPWLSRWKKDKAVPPTPQEVADGAAAVAEEEARKSLDERNKVRVPYDDADMPEREPSKTSLDGKEVEMGAGKITSAVEGENMPPVKGQITPAAEDEVNKGKKEVPPEPTLPVDKGVGFDLDKIRETIASDDGTGQLPMPGMKAVNGQRQSADEARPPTPSNAPKGKSLFGRLRSKPDLARTGSAPVPSAIVQQLPNGQSAQQLQYEAQQRMLEEQERREEEAFMKGLPVNPVYPAGGANQHLTSSSSSLPGLDSAQSNNPFEQSSGLSFGGIDGSISFASEDQSTSTWQSSSNTDNGNAWKDPWQTGSNNAWSTASKW
jgi:hypothetical protein